ncbi:MAG: glycosyltransferase [Polyangiaceae bacterium]
MHYALGVMYFSVLLLLSSYGLHRSHLVLQCWWYRRRLKRVIEEGKQPMTDSELPRVTVQLPLFNESNGCRCDCSRRLPSSTTHAELLEIQVLDDSTDETQALARATVDRIAATGVDMVYIHRVNRVGYKAGALAEGLDVAKGELVAIFDADFIPQPDFLRDCVPGSWQRRNGSDPLGSLEPRRVYAHAGTSVDARWSPPRREPRAIRSRAISSTSRAPAVSWPQAS